MGLGVAGGASIWQMTVWNSTRQINIAVDPTKLPYMRLAKTVREEENVGGGDAVRVCILHAPRFTQIPVLGSQSRCRHPSL